MWHYMRLIGKRTHATLPAIAEVLLVPSKTVHMWWFAPPIGMLQDNQMTPGMYTRCKRQLLCNPKSAQKRYAVSFRPHGQQLKHKYGTSAVQYGK